MPVYKIIIPNSDETETLWAADEDDAVYEGGYGLSGDVTAVPVDETFIPLSQAWQAGDWIASPYALIHSRYARITEPVTANVLPNDKVDALIAWARTALAVEADPVKIVCNPPWWSVIFEVEDSLGTRQVSVGCDFWLPAFECGLGIKAAERDQDVPGELMVSDMFLLTDADGGIVGVIMGENTYAHAGHKIVAWEDAAE